MRSQTWIEALERKPALFDKIPVVLLRDPSTKALYAFDGNHRTLALMGAKLPAGRAIVIDGDPAKVLAATSKYHKVDYNSTSGGAAPNPGEHAYGSFGKFFSKSK